MLLEHRGARPDVDPSAWVAPTAVLCGDVTVGPRARVLFGAVVTAESGPVVVGEQSIVMENAVLRGVSRHPLSLGARCLVGPHAHLSGCTVEDEVFIATAASVFNGAVVGAGSVVRIGGVVHVRTHLPPGSKVPIGWIAVGDPVAILPPEDDPGVSERLAERGFSATVFGLPESRTMEMLTGRYADGLAGYARAVPVSRDG